MTDSRDTTLTLPQAHARIAAARKRLGDLKAVHTRWYEGRSEFDDEARIISEMEDIAYSALLYLSGVPGRYLSQENADRRDLELVFPTPDGHAMGTGRRKP